LAVDQAPIRLLELLPGQMGDQLDCRLRVCSLVHAPSYEALSYCWGNSSTLLPVTVDENTLLVTENLRAALRHLRRSAAPRRLWIDAICINQADVEERSAQVAIMAEIYRNAAQTVIWLGLSEHWSHQALRTLAPLSQRRPHTDSEELLPVQGEHDTRPACCGRGRSTIRSSGHS